MDNKYKSGDVLVFKTSDSFIGKVISRLTDSDVSHSALVYDEKHYVHLVSKGIEKAELSDCPEHSVYQLRHSTETDMTKVIDAATLYLAKDIPYNYPSLVILGGLIIYRKSNYTPEYKAIVNTILGIACWSLDKLLNRIIAGEDNQAMMCSQFAYQCYFDAGSSYRIKIKDGVIWHESREDGGIRLIDLLETKEEMPLFQIQDYDEKDIDEERLAQKLYEALTNESHADGYLANAELEDTLSKASKFLDLLEKILEALGSQMPLPSLFVTPADLCYNAENLEMVR